MCAAAALIKKETAEQHSCKKQQFNYYRIEVPIRMGDRVSLATSMGCMVEIYFLQGGRRAGWYDGALRESRE